MPEPVAAALSFASEVGVQTGAHVVVYDLGGGTFDTAVVTSNGAGFNIVGRPSGDQNIGGELFDEIIVNHLGAQLPAAAWDAIQIGEEPLWQQVASTLRNEARKAKETLSGNPYADLIVPLPTGLQQIRITREEFEELVTPYLAETTVLLDRCVREAGLAPTDLAGISLVGGSSRSPIVERMVKAAFPDVPVIRRGDPKTAVASGAARAVRSSISTLPAGQGQITHEGAPFTAPHSGGLAPPISQPPLAPGGVPSSVPGPYPLSGTQPVPGPQPVAGTQPAPSPSVIPSVLGVPGSSAASVGFPTTGITPPPVAPASVSGPPPVPPAAATAYAGGPPLAPHAYGYNPAAQPAGVGNFAPAPKAKNNRTALLAVLIAVAVIIAVGVVVLATRSSNSSSSQPTRKALNASLEPLSVVKSVMGDGFASAPITGGGKAFCPQFNQAEPAREGEELFSTQTNTSTANFDPDFTLLLQTVGSFVTVQQATDFFATQTSISQSCGTFQSKQSGTTYTYTTKGDPTTARLVGDANVIAIHYTIAPTDTPTDVVTTGYIIEERKGALIFATQLETYGKDQPGDLNSYVAFTKQAFERAAKQL